MSINKLRIPERQKEDFIFFLNLPKQVQEELVDFIRSVPFGMSNNSLVDYAFENIKQLSRDNIVKFLSIFFSLSTAKEELEYNDVEFIDNLKASLYELQNENFTFNEDGFEFFKLLFDSQSTLVKSRNIIREYLINSNNFESSKITTDIRPVFDNNNLIGSTIINKLRITYQKNEEEKDFFVSLDENDINELIKSLNATKEKIKLIKETFKNLEIIDIKK